MLNLLFMIWKSKWLVFSAFCSAFLKCCLILTRDFHCFNSDNLRKRNLAYKGIFFMADIERKCVTKYQMSNYSQNAFFVFNPYNIYLLLQSFNKNICGWALCLKRILTRLCMVDRSGNWKYLSFGKSNILSPKFDNNFG